jgi:hypothetical protein
MQKGKRVDPGKRPDQATTGSRAGIKKMLLGRLHEIETQLNAVASNLPPSTDLDGPGREIQEARILPYCASPEMTHSDCSGLMTENPSRISD